MSSLLIATSRYTYRHPLYSRNRAMIEFLERKKGLGFSKVTVLYPDHLVGGKSPSLKMLNGGLEELRFSLQPLRGEHPALEPSYAASRIVPYFRRRKLRYDYCIAADLTGWQISYPLRKLGCVSYLVYDDQDYFPRVIKSLQGRLASSGLERLIAMTADAVISASETLGELRRRQGARRVHIIPNGVDPSFYKPRAVDPEQRLERRIILYAGSLDREYGVTMLLEAFSKLRESLEATLILVGAGPLAQDLKEEFRGRESDSKVHVLDRVEHEKLAGIMREATVGVAPYLEGSSAAYGVPMKIKEYLAVGLPVVASAVGEIPRFLDSKQVGIAVRPAPGNLAQALGKILSLDASGYAAMSRAARRLAEDYSWDDLFSQYFQILCEGT